MEPRIAFFYIEIGMLGFMFKLFRVCFLMLFPKKASNAFGRREDTVSLLAAKFNISKY